MTERSITNNHSTYNWMGLFEAEKAGLFIGTAVEVIVDCVPVTLDRGGLYSIKNIVLINHHEFIIVPELHTALNHYTLYK